MAGDQRRAWWVLACVAIPLFAVCVNTTSINTALPAIADSLDTDLPSLQWVVNSYILVAAAFVVTGGRLGDLLGRRRVFLVGVAVFGAASVLIALADSVGVLIAGRGLQGLGSAMIVPGSLSLVGVAFPPDRRTAAIGVWAAIVGLGFALGPLIGGALTVSLGWEWVWWANVPLVAVAIVLALARVPESRDEGELSVDLPGIALLGTAAFALVFGLTQGREWGWGDARVVGLFVLAAALFAAFAGAESRRRLPLVHLRFFRFGGFTAGVVGTFAATLTLLGAYYYLNLFLQSFVVFDLSALEAGAALLPMSLSMFAVSLAAGPIAQRVGARGPVTLGFLSIGLGFLLVAQVDPGSKVVDLVPGFVLVGAGMGMVTGPTSAAAVAAVPEEDEGEASGVVNMGRYLGGSIGVAMTGALYLATGLSSLNERLGAENVGAREEARLDTVLSGAADTAREAVVSLPFSARADFTEAARNAAVDAFVAANRGMAIVALATAVVSLLLLRRPHRAERHHLAHAAAVLHTAHHAVPSSSATDRVSGRQLASQPGGARGPQRHP
jgi:MFS transporter, DHA2 family, methylenomycin A resistance protein